MTELEKETDEVFASEEEKRQSARYKKLAEAESKNQNKYYTSNNIFSRY
jgi:hypothetical protein